MKENSKEKAQCYGLKNGFLSCTSTKEVTVFWIYQSNQKNLKNYFHSPYILHSGIELWFFKKSYWMLCRKKCLFIGERNFIYKGKNNLPAFLKRFWNKFLFQ